MIDAAGRELASTVSALSDDRLLEQTTNLALLDHEVQVFVIDHLLEIEARGLYLSRGYSNLFAYVTRGLGYSDGAAWRRIAAMKLCARIEGTRDRLRDGSLTLDAAAQLQAAFERRDREQARLARGAKAGTAGAAKPNGRAASTPERKPPPVLDLSARKALVGQAAGKSTRQVMQMLAAVDPALAVPADRIRPLGEGRWELKAVVDEECQRGLEQLKGFLSHVDPRMTLGQLVARLVRDGLDRYDPGRPPRRRANLIPAAAAARTSAPKDGAPSDRDVPAVERTAKRADATARAAGEQDASRDTATAPAEPEPTQPSQDRGIPAVAPATPPQTRTATRSSAVPASAPKPDAPSPGTGSSPSKASRDSGRGATSAPKRREPPEGTDASPSNRPVDPDPPTPSASKPAAPVAGGITSAPKRCAAIGRAIPAGVRRRVWQRDQGRCSYEDPVSGRRCGSRHLIQVDHIFPYALGGDAEVPNLRLLCFAHHRLRHAARVNGERRQRKGTPDIRRTT